MKHLASTLWLLSALVLLCGCAGVGKTSGPPSGPPSLFLNLAGNWQFSTTSTVQGKPVGIAGSIKQSGSAVSGAVHVDSFFQNCFDPLTTIGLGGTLTGSNLSLTSTSVAGQVIAFTGSIVNNAFTGTYTINGGCANGDHGSVTGIKIPTLASTLNGTFTSGNLTFDVLAQVTQGSAGPEGSFGLYGTVTFGSSCLGSGTIKSGTFPSGSFIIGTSVALEIETANGTVTFLGTANPTTGGISGDYTVSGGTCDQTGTAVLVASDPWGY